jgi:threonine dehydratase
MPRQDLPTHDDVVEAAGRIRGQAVRTPLLESPALNEIVGGRLLIKAEVLQRTGSFKFRGAYNRISRLDRAERARGVVAYSSGNHAQGVAAAASLLGIGATIFMPADAPAIKLDRTRALGARVVAYERATASREELAERFANEHGATLVRPYEDRYVIAGQGTVGLEIAEDLAARGIAPDVILVPCGGGGLAAGCALALRRNHTDTPIYTVEPDGYDDTARSLEAGARLRNEASPQSRPRSRCDALLAPTPGELTFAVNRRLLSGGLAVGEAAVAGAMALAFAHLKLVVEPGGAVALAAALAGAFDCRGKTAAIVCSGGNADAAAYFEAIREGEAALSGHTKDQ